MTVFVGTLLLLGLVALLVWAIALCLSVLGGAQLVTTPKSVYPRMLEFAGISPSESFIELGSGLGYVAAAAARFSESNQVVGVDISPLWVWLARLLHRGSGATFRVGNVYATDLRSIDVVYCYLLPSMLTKLEEKFAEELKSGSRVITYGFPLPNRQPTSFINRTADHGPLFLYEY